MSAVPDFPAAFPNPQAPKSPAEKPREKAPQRPAGRQAPLEARLLEAISSVGMIVMLVNEIDGLAIIQGAERFSKSLDKAAKQNPAVRRALEAALTGGVWAEVTFASAAIVVPIAINHRMLPAKLTGFLPQDSAELFRMSVNGDGGDNSSEPEFNAS